MIFLKPSWVNHEDDKPIFSVDIHPNGGRFATGGQGASGGRIVIWNIGPVINEHEETDPKIPKMLCQMDNHLACVNVVRWSNAGHLLASGGDDKLVMIWRLTNEGSSSVFGSGKVNVETWKCMHTLNSHNGDVLDIAWAPHDGWLASGSVDNTVIIWNAHKFPEKVAVLKSHTGMVKGVTWDPVGKYIASQSDDKSLRIWRTSDWAQQEVVTDPFVECSATTHVLRLSWSPDGQYLVSAHAMNGGGPTAQIIEREGWRQDKDFVGHRKAITCVRFNSNILKKQTSSSPKSTQYCCCAIGSRDRSISVWLTSLKRPLVVIKDLFDDSVLDISWSSNGLYLLACSWDGTVACVTFTQEEIGTPLSMDEKNALYETVYHKSLQRNWNLSFTGTQVVENPDLLSAIDEINEKNDTSTANKIEFQEPQPVVKDVAFESPKLNQSILVPANKQLETRLPSGKRRITPMLLTSVPNTNKDSSADHLNVNSDTQFPSQTSFSKSSPVKSQIIVETIKQPQEKPKTSSELKTFQSGNEIHKVVVQPPGTQINQLMCCEVPGDEPIIKIINVLDPLKMPPGVTVTKECGTMKIQVTNNCHKTPKGSLSRIEVFKNINDKDPKWDTYLGSSIRCMACNRKTIVACCEDLTINCYDLKSGARSLPPLLIEDVVSSLSLSQNSYCLVLTKTGLLHMWDLQNSKSLLTRISVRSLLTGKGSVNGCSLSSTNQPVLTLSDGRAYSYCMNLQTWVQLSNPLDPVSGTGGNLIRRVPANLPLASLQRHMPVQRCMDTLPPGVTLSFLESQITATSVLQSAAEYRHWLIATVNHLLDKGPECRLRLVLDDLMGPNHTSSKKQKMDTRLEGTNRTLLNEVLAIIKTKLPWQRLYKEYSEQLSDP
ncbi:protein HIRA homolog [Anoplophora glabripennis]|uniref:protein HIRA homolog n=2 Tax=Anoplophora glabripennis TaxID=217634 RepID=UPI0008757F05|nr:protein HIRA homolog [Anoplophora glabripennis]